MKRWLEKEDVLEFEIWRRIGIRRVLVLEWTTYIDGK